MGLRPLLWVACKAAARHPPVVHDDSAPPRRPPERPGYPVPVRVDGIEVEDLTVLLDATPLTVRSYRPPNAAGPLPVHLYAHGGSFSSGAIWQLDAICRRYARSVPCRVLSIGYRLAPEHPWPAALEDFYGVLCWVADHAQELGVDAERISVGGASCGANLATVTALMTRERGGPPVVFQLLEVPAVDATLSRASMEQFATGYLVTRAELARGWAYYVPEGADRGDPHISPLCADLTGLAPAAILTCEFDPLRDEGEEYARRLSDSGVTVQVLRARGHIHSSAHSQSWLIPSSRRYQRWCAARLRDALQ